MASQNQHDLEFHTFAFTIVVTYALLSACIICHALVTVYHLQGWTKRNAFHVCITSYNIAVQDHRALKQKKWKYLILDEVLF